MATTKTTTRSRSTSRTTAARSSSAPTAKSSAKADDSLIARTGRTIKERPYTSAAIATGAVTAVAAAAAGAFFFSRRDKSSREAGETVTHKVIGSFADAKARIKELIHSGDGKSQQEIAEEALTLKETGGARRPVDSLAPDQIKAGSVAY